jgi:hypothetical protein
LIGNVCLFRPPLLLLSLELIQKRYALLRTEIGLLLTHSAKFVQLSDEKSSRIILHMAHRATKVCTVPSTNQHPKKTAVTRINSIFISRKELGGYSVHHLCKSLIIENTEWTPTFAPNGECADPTYSRFYCLIVQYTTRYAQR